MFLVFLHSAILDLRVGTFYTQILEPSRPKNRDAFRIVGKCPVAALEGMFHASVWGPAVSERMSLGVKRWRCVCLDSWLPVAEAFCLLPRSRFVNGFRFLFGPHYPDSSITGFVTLSRPIRWAACHLFFIYSLCSTHSPGAASRVYPSRDTHGKQEKSGSPTFFFLGNQNPLLRGEKNFHIPYKRSGAYF